MARGNLPRRSCKRWVWQRRKKLAFLRNFLCLKGFYPQQPKGLFCDVKGGKLLAPGVGEIRYSCASFRPFLLLLALSRRSPSLVWLQDGGEARSRRQSLNPDRR